MPPRFPRAADTAHAALAQKVLLRPACGLPAAPAHAASRCRFASCDEGDVMSPVRRLGSIAVLAGFVFLGLGAVVAFAAPTQTVTWTYYSDRRHVDMVGEKTFTCQ